MYYNSIVFSLLFFLLAGCASTTTQPVKQTKPAAAANTQAEAKAEISMYTAAMADINNNKLQQARELLNNLTSKHPELAGPWANLALIDIKNDKLSDARKHVDMALKRDPSMPQAYNLLGYLDKKQGHIKKAINDYLKAIAKKPDYAIAHYNVALLYDIYLQDVPDAISHYKRYLALTGNKDTRTSEWVHELQNSLKQGAP